MKGKQCAIMNTKITRQLHKQLDSVLIVVAEEQVSESHQHRHHKLVTEARGTAVSKNGVPQHQSFAELKLSPEQEPEPADAINLGEYLELL